MTKTTRMMNKAFQTFTLLATIAASTHPTSLLAQRYEGAGVLPPPSAGGPAFDEPTLNSPNGPSSPTPSPPANEEAISPGYSSLPPAAAVTVAETIPTPPAEPLIDPTAVLQSTPMDLVITPTPHWYDLAYWFGPDPWEGHLELGFNGSKGNNETLSMRAGGHVKRKTKRLKFASDLQYNKNVANDIETQNNSKLDVRLDRVLGDSRWTLFFLNNLIYDEFQVYDLQLSLTGGVGYQIFDTETIDLLSRFGSGTTREFGGPDNEWAANALFGLDYEHRLTKTQRLTAKVDYYPEWDDFSRYRVVSDAGWEIDLDKPANVSLKFSVIDRYDSTPNGRSPNNFDYAMLMIWGL